MCYQTKCPKCGKVTWGGCGAHIEAALRGVPKDELCTCNAATKQANAAPPPSR